MSAYLRAAHGKRTGLLECPPFISSCFLYSKNDRSLVPSLGEAFIKKRVPEGSPEE